MDVAFQSKKKKLMKSALTLYLYDVSSGYKTKAMRHH